MLGLSLLADLTEEQIRSYIRKRIEDGVSGRTVNMEIGELWARNWEDLARIKKLEERKDVGRALSLTSNNGSELHFDGQRAHHTNESIQYQSGRILFRFDDHGHGVGLCRFAERADCRGAFRAHRDRRFYRRGRGGYSLTQLWNARHLDGAE